MPDHVSPAPGRSALPARQSSSDGSAGARPRPGAGAPLPGDGGVPQRGLPAPEDWWAIGLGGLLIAVAAFGLLTGVAGLGRWTGNPLDAFDGRVAGLAMLGLGLALVTGLAARAMGARLVQHQAGSSGCSGLQSWPYTLANQSGIRAAGVGYAFWALALGLVVSNTAGAPGWLKPAVRSELYIKTGLVLLGAEVLFNRILTLGPPGLVVAWLVTPIVIVFMYRFGTRVLKMTSPSLVIVIAAATSVCGVSAAIATAAAAAREEGRADPGGRHDPHLHRRHDDRHAPRHPRRRHGPDGRGGLDRRHRGRHRGPWWRRAPCWARRRDRWPRSSR